MKQLNVIIVAIVLVFLPQLNAAQGAIQYYDAKLSPQDQLVVNAHLKTLKDGTPYYIIRIDLDAFLQNEVLINFPPDSQERMQLRNLTRYNDRDYSIRGGNGQKNTYSLTNVDGRITGNIRIESKTWTVHALSNGLEIVYPESGFKSECLQPENNPAEDFRELMIEELEKSQNIKSSMTSNCQVRLLVMFTANTDTVSEFSIMSEIRNSIDYFNEANDNSEVYFQVELARVVRTQYEESHEDDGAHFVDLIRFHDLEDGYMDIVDNYREAYDADMCILLVTSLPGGSGQAWSIGASYDQAFVVAQWSATSSFTHEFGHLIGCEHDPFVLSHNDECNDVGVPTGCNHGYVNLAEDNLFRTIMSYEQECTCAGTNCNRIAYWSNPNINYGGDPTGTACNNPLARENNANKLNDDYDIQASHEPYVSHKTWDYTGELEHEVIEEREYGDLLGEFTLRVAENSTTTYKVQPGGEAKFRAGERITFYPGFTARSGSIAHAFLESCNDIGNLTEDIPVLSQEFYNENTGDPEFSVKAEVDNAKATLSVSCIVGVDADITLDLCDSAGNTLLPLMSGSRISCGKYALSKNVANLGTGPFEIRMSVATGSIKKVMRVSL